MFIMRNCYTLSFLLITIYWGVVPSESKMCDRGRVVERKYLLYEINSGEGFNLRRDVYIRLAVLMHTLQKFGDWVLILPPWGPLPHWKSKNVKNGTNILWGKFFNISSLQKHVPVMELEDLISEKKEVLIDEMIILQHFKNAWVDGKWEEKFKYEICDPKLIFRRLKTEFIDMRLWNQERIRVRNVSCVSFQGHANTLVPLLIQGKGKTFMIDRAEIPLHDEYGNNEYWKVRRSMRFSSRLYSLANEFRKVHLLSGDDLDLTQMTDDWRDEGPREIPPIGGNYICGHLRRQDFLWGRPDDVPSLKEAAKQLENIAKFLGIRNIFIASDGTSHEMEELRSFLEPYYFIFYYQPSIAVLEEIGDGGVAIVDQIICSRSRYFIGSHESTFSFRIQEEREILNFPSNSTFNRFCGDSVVSCEQPSKWKIIY